MPFALPPELIALEVTGDIGDYTLYRNKNYKTVVFPKDWRQDKQSPARETQQTRFKNAQASWSSLDPSEKNNLEEACRQLSMPLTGQNLWIHTALTNDKEGYLTVQSQSGISLPAPPIFVP